MDINFTHYQSGSVEINYWKPELADEEDRIASDFIHKIFKRFAQMSLKSFHPRKNLIDMPHYHSERRFDSVVLPVLFDLCNGIVLTELPVRRKERGEEENHNGRVDYWCVYKDYTFVIEMKHTFHNLDGKVVRQNSMKDRWKNMSTQLDDCRKHLRKNMENTKGIIPIGIHFVTTRRWETTRLKEWGYDELLQNNTESMCKFIGELKPEVDYAASWIVPQSIAMATTKDNDVFSYRFLCPYVMIFAQVKKVINHKGSQD